MDSTRPPSRFVRGRARGGGAYRPYFYFRRNGRTIPAGGAQTEQWGTGNANRSFRGGRGGRKRGRGQLNDSGILPPLNESTFFRSEHYAAPEDALQVQSVTVDTRVQCPGWNLYFPTEKYQDSSETVKRLKALETHFITNPLQYDVTKIQSDCSFILEARILNADVNVTLAWPLLSKDLETRPLRTVATFGLAMYNIVYAAAIDASVSEQSSTPNYYMPRFSKPRKIFARPVGFVINGLLSQISNENLDHLYCVRGTVLAVGAVELSASWVCFKCTRCTQEQSVKQIGYHPCRPFTCKRDGCLAKKGFVEQRCSPYTRVRPMQIIRVAENHVQALDDLEDETPDYIDIDLSYDLVDSLGCGQDCTVTGVLKMRPLAEEQDCKRNALQSSSKSKAPEIYLKALSIVDARVAGHSLSASDLNAISSINSDPDCFKILVNSLAPEILGHELAKAGLLLALFGGSGSQIHDESEINVLLVGDPGVGKSCLLQMCTKISEKGVFMQNKRGSTMTQKLTTSLHGRTNLSINAGAFVAAINGHCSIDDIDRLASQQDTLLQVMQTQTTSLPFPSLFTTLSTPTSIIATINSARGHYDHSKALLDNIRISPSLLSQFHLVFVLMDRPNKDRDNALTEHIKSLHAGAKKSSAIAARYDVRPKTNNSMSIADEAEAPIDEHYDLGRHLKMANSNIMDDDDNLLPSNVIKKFILYARKQVRPLLTKEAADMIRNFYMELRKEKNTEKCQSVSTSHLEALIRLSQARARVDFATEVTVHHVRDVICIVRQSMSDTEVGDYVDTDPAGAVSSNKRGSVKKFIQMLQAQSSALSRRIFEFDELKDMARHAGISCGVSNLVEVVNLQGYLIKKAPNLYEVTMD